MSLFAHKCVLFAYLRRCSIFCLFLQLMVTVSSQTSRVVFQLHVSCLRDNRYIWFFHLISGTRFEIRPGIQLLLSEDIHGLLLSLQINNALKEATTTSSDILYSSFLNHLAL